MKSFFSARIDTLYVTTVTTEIIYCPFPKWTYKMGNGSIYGKQKANYLVQREKDQK